MIAKKMQPDHVHLFLSFPPSFSISEMVKAMKGRSARKAFEISPILKVKLWKGMFWSPSDRVGTARNVAAVTIQRYINRSERIRNRQWQMKGAIYIKYLDPTFNSQSCHKCLKEK